MISTIRLWLCGILFCFGIIASAQSSLSLVLDAASLSRVNVDDVTGLALDPIMKDRSNRSCARIKLHINRMTPEEVRELEVRAVGGNVIVMKHQPVEEGNGLIIELTARPDTRFYLHHDKYGDSNQVTVDLQGDTEYRMEGWNEARQSIVVSYHSVGSEVYLDDIFRGYIGPDYLLTVVDVTMGIHKLSLKSADGDYALQINISPSTVFFNISQNLSQDKVPDIEYAQVDQVSENENIDIDNDSNNRIQDNIILMAPLGVAPKLSAGMMLGYVRRIGGYMKIRSNFNFTDSSYNCASNGATESGELLLTTGAKDYKYFLVTGGIIVRLSKNIYPYLGLGYSDSEVLWEDYKGEWARVTDCSYKGLTTEVGVVYQLTKFSFSIGVSAASAYKVGLDLGVGFMF